MHILEDHATEWASLTHVVLGSGTESIHAKFNSLARAYTAIADQVERLSEGTYFVSIAPAMVAAIPPPKKRKKSVNDNYCMVFI